MYEIIYICTEKIQNTENGIVSWNKFVFRQDIRNNSYITSIINHNSTLFWLSFSSLYTLSTPLFASLQYNIFCVAAWTCTCHDWVVPLEASSLLPTTWVWPQLWQPTPLAGMVCSKMVCLFLDLKKTRPVSRTGSPRSQFFLIRSNASHQNTGKEMAHILYTQHNQQSQTQLRQF